jgi:hypothetical protein
MSSIPLLISFYLRANEKTKDFPAWFKVLFKGFWLGILSREQLQLVDLIYYEQTSDYCDENYNKSGFFNWERKAFLKFFQSCQTLLVTAIGGGREVFALHQIGFDTDGFECNRQLFEFAEKLFERGNIEGEFHLVPRDEVWHFGKIYDGAIVGWSSYMLIQGRARRIEFLKNVRAQLESGAPLLISFFSRNPKDEHFKTIAMVGNVFRALRFAERLETGDDLFGMFIHRFIREEIAEEVAEAGFTLAHFAEEADSAYAVAIAAESAS